MVLFGRTINLDWQHVTLLTLGGINAFGPAIALQIPHGTVTQITAILGPVLAVGTTVLAILKATPVEPKVNP